MRQLTIFGSTGSIGINTLDVVAKFPKDFCIHALVAHSSKEKLLEQVMQFKPKMAVLFDSTAAEWLRQRANCPVYSAEEGLFRAVENCDILVQAMSSTIGIAATLEALKNGCQVAIANKETIIAAHNLIRPYLHLIRPIDSEHSSLFKLYEEDRPIRTTITASGGPFLKRDLTTFDQITLDQALTHPNWSMGVSNTINSSTLFNKVLEVFEAYYLFDQLPTVIIEPTSRIHAIATYADGMTQMVAYPPDMRIPILHALSIDKKFSNPYKSFLDFSAIEFVTVDERRFPLMQLVQLGKNNSCAPAFFMFLNELLMQDFLQRKITWLQLQHHLLDAALDCPNIPLDSIASIEELKLITKRIHQCNILQSSMV
jgi:1-deoxy-D-xylulose-5-phosphate reductoisomerase